MFDHLLANRLQGLAGEAAFKTLAAANRLEAQGKKVIYFEIGEPDFPTAKNIAAAGKKALDDGFTTYCQSQGVVKLREAIAEHVFQYKGIKTEIDEIVVTPGGKPAIFYTICVLVNPGEEVIYPNPGFPAYSSVIRYAGGIPVPVDLREENDFRLDINELKAKITSKTKLIILNSPSNPTGSVLTRSDLEALADVIKGKDIFVMSDEIYDRILYDGKVESIAVLPGMKDKTIIVDGFSKAYCMTGWRLGYGIMHKEIAQSVTRLLINSNSCTTHFVQIAGIEALTGPQDSVGQMTEEYRRRRDVMVDGLNSMEGITCRNPKGAFYAFPNITGTGLKSSQAADYLLNEAGVALLDGSSFGSAGEGYLRLSYATSMDNIHAGLEKIQKALREMIS